jgi:hypothetical protein
MSNLYHDHLDVCKHCSEHPFNPCQKGDKLLHKEVTRMLEFYKKDSKMTHAFSSPEHRSTSRCTCGSMVKRHNGYDTYYCANSGVWLEPICECPTTPKDDPDHCFVRDYEVKRGKRPETFTVEAIQKKAPWRSQAGSVWFWVCDCGVTKVNGIDILTASCRLCHATELLPK